MSKPSLLLIGCGKMGAALLEGWLDRDICREIRVVEPAGRPGDLAAAAHPSTSMAFHISPADLPAGFRPDATVIAVKPQLFEAVLPAYRGLGGLVISIAAGRTLQGIAGLLKDGGGAPPLVRAMPNTPAAVGRGITAAIAGGDVPAELCALANVLLGAVGEVVWLTEETLIDAVTAVSGGGPAYVFLLMEALAAAGAAAGLPADLAERLARVTVSGAGELARLSAEPAPVLRRNVTSPNGTTQAALEVLMGADGMGPLFERAIAAAAARSRALAS